MASRTAFGHGIWSIPLYTGFVIVPSGESDIPHSMLHAMTVGSHSQSIIYSSF